MLETDGLGRLSPELRAFIAQRSSAAANAFLQWAHNYPKKRQLTHKQFAVTLWSALGVPLSIDAYICRHCHAQNCEFYSHSEQCTQSRFRTTVDGVKVPCRRSMACHEALQKTIAQKLAMIPDVAIRGFHPKLGDMFPRVVDHPVRLESQAAANARRAKERRERERERMEGERIVNPVAPIAVDVVPVNPLAPPLVQPEPPAERLPVQEAADIELAITFPNDPAAVAIDHTVTGVHAPSNFPHLHGADKFTGGFADVGQRNKDLKHSAYETDGNAWGFGMDSMGGFSDGMAKYLLHLYAKSKNRNVRRWDSDTMRVACKRLFICSVSSVLARHRALDYMHQGIPNRRRGGRQEAVRFIPRLL